jgi:DNA-binding MurR/RpiR family transcriptional regulator
MPLPDDVDKTHEAVPALISIRQHLRQLTPMQRRMAKFILKRPRDVIKMSISELAMQSGAKSESSVVRFYRALGYSGYHDFKVSLATEIAGKSFYHTYQDITLDDDVSAVKEKIFQGAMKTLHENLIALNTHTLKAAIDIIESAKRLIFIGYGPSGMVAADAYFKFSRIGLNCHYSPDSHINTVVLANPREGDVVFCISYSGESKDVVVPLERIKPIVKIIALTGFADSHLGHIADLCIASVSEEMNYRTDAMITRIVQLAITGTLYTAIAIRKGSDGLDRLSKTRQALSYLKY